MPRSLTPVLVALAAVACAACTLQRPYPLDPSLELQPLTHVAVAAPAGAEDPGAATAPDPGTETLRVATYNVHMESAATIARAIRARPALSEVDVWLVQEIETRPGEIESEAGKLARELGMGHVYAPAYGLAGGGSHGLAIVSRLPLSDVELIELPYFDVHFNAGRRVALAATVGEGDARMRVYSVHLDNRLDPARRLAQVAPVARAAREDRGVPVIIGGDFNTSPFTWRGHVLPVPGGRQAERLERFLRDHGFAAPTRRSGPTSAWLRMRLDALFSRGAVVTGMGVDRHIRVSDHFPVWIDVDPGARDPDRARVSTR